MHFTKTRRSHGRTEHHTHVSLVQWPFRSMLSCLLSLLILGFSGAIDDVLDGGTLMFLHVWKCGGTSLRKLLCNWADSEGLPCATVATCKHLSLEERKICLLNHRLIFSDVQEEYISKLRVIAGHFQWGFQDYAKDPHFMVTTLRNPLELFVSGEMYNNRKDTATLPTATRFVTESMRQSMIDQSKKAGYLHRFVGRTVMTVDEVRAATVEGAYNMDSFWLVGVVEQYQGFITVMQHLLDPWDRRSTIWRDHLNEKLNASPVQGTNVLASIDPHLVNEFNTTLSYQWLLYGKAVRLFRDRCHEVIPEWRHHVLCNVPLPPSEYY